MIDAAGVSEREGHHDRADRGSGTKPAEFLRAGMQNIHGEYGQERGGAAKEHSEEVERNGGEDQFVGNDEADAFEEGFQSSFRLVRAFWPAATDRSEADETEDCESDLEDVYGPAAGDGEEETRKRGPGDVGDFHRAAVPGDGVADEFDGDDLGQERASGRPLECAGERGEQQAGVDDRDGAVCKQEQRRSGKVEPLSEHHDGAAIVAVGDVACEKGEQEKGRHLDEAHIAQDKRGMGLGVKIPAYGDREHLQAEVREEAASEEEPVVAQAEGDVGVQIRAYTRWVVTVE